LPQATWGDHEMSQGVGKKKGNMHCPAQFHYGHTEGKGKKGKSMGAVVTMQGQKERRRRGGNCVYYFPLVEKKDQGRRLDNGQRRGETHPQFCAVP